MKRTRGPVSPAPRATLGQRTATGPMPVWISRSGNYDPRRPADPFIRLDRQLPPLLQVNAAQQNLRQRIVLK